MEAWVTATGERCGCVREPPAKRKRGRPATLRVGKCRSCWRSLATDRFVPPPHNLSLLSRCIHDLRAEDSGLDTAPVREALMTALVDAGFEVEMSSASFRDGGRTRVLKAQTVWGWRDRRGHHDIFVAQSEVLRRGRVRRQSHPEGQLGLRHQGGLRPSASDTDLQAPPPHRPASPPPRLVLRPRAYPALHHLTSFLAAKPGCGPRASDPQAAYVIRVGPRYVDCRDPGGLRTTRSETRASRAERL